MLCIHHYQISDDNPSGYIIYQILPTTIITLIKATHAGDFDHCGIIIKDEYGAPYVYELTPGGIRLHSYASRVLRSKARQIIVIPIATPFEITVERRKELLVKYKDESSKVGPFSYLTRFLLGMISFSVDSILGSQVFSTSYSPECEHVLNALKEMSDERFDKIPIPKGHTTTCKTLFDQVNRYSHRDNIFWVR